MKDLRCNEVKMTLKTIDVQEMLYQTNTKPSRKDTKERI